MASDIEAAVGILRNGGLVGMPTETVYGLAGDARDELAVRRIFAAKGRPAAHPVIVHVAGAEALNEWAREVPESAWQLAEAFWPGPLTLVLRRQSGVLDAITGGQETVALRVPDHPVALELLRAFGSGLAAPSANRYGKVSPTTAAHVREGLGNEVALVLDGGPCVIGLESTIVDLSSEEPALLRPGAITPEMLTARLGRRVSVRAEGGTVRVPGQVRSHYAPAAGVTVVPHGRLSDEASRGVARGLKVAGLTTQPVALPDGATAIVLMGGLPELARSLYARFRELDSQGYGLILVEEPDEEGLGLALRDRLRRAAAR